jgi:hypothetical protein
MMMMMTMTMTMTMMMMMIMIIIIIIMIYSYIIDMIMYICVPHVGTRAPFRAFSGPAEESESTKEKSQPRGAVLSSCQDAVDYSNP